MKSPQYIMKVSTVTATVVGRVRVGPVPPRLPDRSAIEPGRLKQLPGNTPERPEIKQHKQRIAGRKSRAISAHRLLNSPSQRKIWKRNSQTLAAGMISSPTVSVR
ncbi:MAG: hypothetical protein H6651_00085 [Ardenticatenales bacterium]|nr:hypothetical protein [Ardenticatenales bacterium]